MNLRPTAAIAQCHRGSSHRYTAAGMADIGAPTDSNGTAQAIDQGTNAAMTTTESSMARAISSLSSMSGFPNSQVTMMASVWLQAVTTAEADTRTRVPKGPTFFDKSTTFSRIRSNMPVPWKMPAQEEERQTMAATFTMDTSPPPPRIRFSSSWAGWKPNTAIWSRSRTPTCWKQSAQIPASRILAPTVFFTATWKKPSTRIAAAGRSTGRPR